MVGLGVFIVGAGIGNMIRAGFGHFGRGLKCGPRTAALAGTLGRVGYFGRGLAMLPAGVFMLAAGWHARASEAKSLGGVLQALHHQTMGDTVLVALAVGLIAFGAFGFVEAWHRPIRPEAGLSPDGERAL